MDPKTIKRRITSLYCIAIGVTSIIAWSIILFFNQLPQHDSTITSFIFQWFSEFIGGTLLIIAGISILYKNPMRKALLFIALGFNVAASLAASGFYLLNFEMFPFILTTTIFVIAILISGWNYGNWRDLIFLTLSLGIYGSISLLGSAIADANYNNVFKSIPIVVFSIWATIVFYNRVHYKETIEKSFD